MQFICTHTCASTTKILVQLQSTLTICVKWDSVLKIEHKTLKIYKIIQT